ncbi:pentapeptide repeat-containing protein [Paenibacillus sp. MZ04-78.2]|uniref:pentapeptide repeat-containing protein n=1 Tax=Paenibacillus sp. MZ04-78.2 TaxID=2962034 RepID=UPI0020B83E3B|nr:pentapeptide repeat-containing protein [Paenibacillus sp. MZ04-78.2]MCP3773304.1 pentapeptide repeat-containing protein [Paenibacillus sp. MZ04-78.2]
MFIEEEYYDEHFLEAQYSQKEVTSVRFYDCTFTKCDFSETVFKDCKFSGCTFENCNLSLIQVLDSDFSQVSFTHSKLIGINWSEMTPPRKIGSGLLRFEECTLSHSTFIGLTLPKCVITRCTAKNVDFREADLTEANMSSTDFSESLFDRTNLTAADFSFATNYMIDPGLNPIRKAKFTLPEAISLLNCMDIQLIDGD